MWRSIPNLLTLFRFILIPAFLFCFFMPGIVWRAVAVMIFVLAYATDWLDGYLARRLSQVSPLGAFLDPVADKVLIATGLVVLITDYPHLFFALPASLIIAREIMISGLREWMAKVGKSHLVAVDHVGKFKTIFQGLALILLLCPPLQIPFIPVIELGYGLLYGALVLTLWSMGRYFYLALPALKSY